MDIVKFLRARIAEDEAGVNTYGAAIAASSDHDQRRLIAECAAKRQLIDLAFEHEESIDGEMGCCCSAERIRNGKCPNVKVNEIPLLLLLAQPYVAHRDFDPAWS